MIDHVNFGHLNGMEETLKYFIPIELMQKYSDEQYIGRYKNIPVSEEKTIENMKHLIYVLQGENYFRSFRTDDDLIRRLESERDAQALNIETADQRLNFINWYNKKVLEKVQNYIENIHQKLKLIFNNYFNEEEIKELNLKGSFSTFYEIFSSISNGSEVQINNSSIKVSKKNTEKPHSKKEIENTTFKRFI